MERAEEVRKSEWVGTTKQKIFKPKNDLQKLANYETDPGAAFWERFPVNRERKKTALIDHQKLRRLADMCGMGRSKEVDQVCEDLRNGANIGCEGSCRAATRSTNASSAVEYGEQARFNKDKEGLGMSSTQKNHLLLGGAVLIDRVSRLLMQSRRG